ncbi:hypothetical protein M422DRAFT_249215 [Sphaerobolus stellatus SS14]|nr:hypothetical protein M422DRAFT_249215 [Sphaerobolus stellatus SS14]
MSYASIDPVRVRTLVIFLKVWSKRRKINSPYLGTLSSYGYALLVIFFLVHVKNPPVLPNLQQLPPPRPVPYEDTHIGGNDVWFFDDIDLLKERWQSSNTESVGELLIDFFKYYSRDFTYNTGVASIKMGLLKKSAKGWLNEYKDGRDERNRFCIEDPFETDFNVARCVTKEGLYAIRGEFMRASRILAARPERTIMALAQLCEEREDEFARPLPSQPFVPPRLSIPSQPPYSVNSSELRPSGSLPEFFTPASSVPISSRMPGDDSHSNSSPPKAVDLPSTVADTPEHMAPKRSKYTSPPPPDDPEHKSYENRLGLGISLATSSTTARQPVRAEEASSSSSEILSDEDRAEVESVGSLDGIGTGVHRMPMSQELKRLSFFATTSEEEEPGWLVINTPKANTQEPLGRDNQRGRAPLRFGFGVGDQSATPTPTPKSHARTPTVEGVPIPDSPRRSMSGPPGSAPRWVSHPQAHLSRRVPSDENVEEEIGTATYPGGSYPPAGQGLQFGDVRTPFPFYQHQAVAHMNAYMTTAPSHAFTVHHPGPIVAPPPVSIPMEYGRHSWHQNMGMGMGYGSPGSSTASSPVSTRRAKLPVPQGVKAPSSPGSGAVSPTTKTSPSLQWASPGSQAQSSGVGVHGTSPGSGSGKARSPKNRGVEGVVEVQSTGSSNGKKASPSKNEAAVEERAEEQLSQSVGSLKLGSSSTSASSSSASPVQSPR